jgi:cystathionine beta-lyase
VALEAAYRSGHEWLDQLLKYLKGNLDFLMDYVQTELPGIRMSPPEATYLAWLDMKGLEMNPKELRKLMIEEAGLGFNDGPSFGPGGKGFQRLNFACSRVILSKALNQLKEALNQRK